MSERKKGSTGVSLLFRLTDSTTGAAKSGIDVTTLKLQYERPGSAASTATSLTLLAALTTAHTDYGAHEVDATNSKGVYRVDCPDAGFATGADEVTWTVTGTGIEPSTRLIDLIDPVTISATVNDGSAAAGSFIGSAGLDGSHDDFYAGCTLVFTSGSLQGIARKVSSYTSSTKTLHFSGATGDADQAFPMAPSNGDSFYLIGRIGH
jgi:hypothetical protein